jgi:UDP-glucose 4-epimerase
MKTLVLGALGYLGSSITKSLVQENYDVSILIRKIPPHYPQLFKRLSNIYEGDVSDADILKDVIKQKFEIIINLISIDQNNDFLKDDKIAYETNIYPSLYILSNSKDNPNLTYVNFSSFQIYGNKDNDIYSEDLNAYPENIYGLYHNMREQVVNYFNKNSTLNCLNLRVTNSYGYPLNNNKRAWNLAVNQFCKDAIQNGKIFIKSDGKPQKDFIHINDVTNALLTIINNRKYLTYNTFNISSGSTLTILDLVKLIKNICKDDFKIDVKIIHNIKLDSNILKKKNEKLMKVKNNRLKNLGFKVDVEIKDGLKHLLEKLNGKAEKES